MRASFTGGNADKAWVDIFDRSVVVPSIMPKSSLSVPHFYWGVQHEEISPCPNVFPDAVKRTVFTIEPPYPAPSSFPHLITKSHLTKLKVLFMVALPEEVFTKFVQLFRQLCRKGISHSVRGLRISHTIDKHHSSAQGDMIIFQFDNFSYFSKCFPKWK